MEQWRFAISRNFGRSTRDLRKNPRYNDEIFAETVRLIGADGKQVGLVPLAKALAEAEIAGLDLVEIAPTAKPPVCKIIDYGKFRYEISKKEKDARKKQHIIQVKKIRMSPNIDDNDLRVKLGMARRFIAEGNRVKVTMFMRGRQVTKPELAEEVLMRIVSELSDISTAEGTPKLEGRNNLSLVLVGTKK